MSKRSKGKRRHEASRAAPEAAPQGALPPAHPPRPNRPVFLVCCVLLGLWILFLMVLAGLSLRGG